MAQAAGEFLNERLFVLDVNAVNGIRTRKGKKRLPKTPLIRDLVQFFIESEVCDNVLLVLRCLQFLNCNALIKNDLLAAS